MDRGEIFWGFDIRNCGGQIALIEVWGVQPEGPDFGSAHWPVERREKWFDSVQAAQARINDLLPELDWIAVA